MPVIYLDVLLCLNLLIDFLLLAATAAWRHLPHRRARLIAAAVIGAISSVAVLLPKMPWTLCMLYDLAVAATMVRVGFAWRGWRSFGVTLITLYLLSAAFGGIATLICLWFSPKGFQVINGVLYYDIPPITLVLMTVISYGVLTLYERFARPRLFRQHPYRLTVEWGGKTAVLSALYDSGNLLTENFSGAPVVIAAAKALGDWDLPQTAEDAARRGFRLIPYRTLTDEGLRPAFRPDRIRLQIGVRPPVPLSSVYVAVVPTIGQGDFDAIIGTPILEQAEQTKEETV